MRQMSGEIFRGLLGVHPIGWVMPRVRQKEVQKEDPVLAEQGFLVMTMIMTQTRRLMSA